MIKEFTRIFLALNILAMPLFAQDTTAANSEELESKINNGLTNTVYSNGNGSKK